LFYFFYSECGVYVYGFFLFEQHVTFIGEER